MNLLTAAEVSQHVNGLGLVAEVLGEHAPQPLSIVEGRKGAFVELLHLVAGHVPNRVGVDDVLFPAAAPQDALLFATEHPLRPTEFLEYRRLLADEHRLIGELRVRRVDQDLVARLEAVLDPAIPAACLGDELTGSGDVLAVG